MGILELLPHPSRCPATSVLPICPSVHLSLLLPVARAHRAPPEPAPAPRNHPNHPQSTIQLRHEAPPASLRPLMQHSGGGWQRQEAHFGEESANITCAPLPASTRGGLIAFILNSLCSELDEPGIRRKETVGVPRKTQKPCSCPHFMSAMVQNFSGRGFPPLPGLGWLGEGAGGDGKQMGK